ncbi:MAG: nucleoside-triphosphatase [Planctomycetota bacterium]|jgi:nucleoside-triphosphatase THEP1
MPVPAANVLLTGKPGCGKTTLVRRVLEHLGGRRLAGFYTGSTAARPCSLTWTTIR